MLISQYHNIKQCRIVSKQCQIVSHIVEIMSNSVAQCKIMSNSVAQCRNNVKYVAYCRNRVKQCRILSKSNQIVSHIVEIESNSVDFIIEGYISIYFTMRFFPTCFRDPLWSPLIKPCIRRAQNRRSHIYIYICAHIFICDWRI